MQVNAGSIVLEASDTRILTFKITDQTRFGDISRADIKQGERLRVEATQDNEANLTATSVTRDTGEAVPSAPSAATASEFSLRLMRRRRKVCQSRCKTATCSAAAVMPA